MTKCDLQKYPEMRRKGYDKIVLILIKHIVSSFELMHMETLSTLSVNCSIFEFKILAPPLKSHYRGFQCSIRLDDRANY
jgi:hypothetical protein